MSSWKSMYGRAHTPAISAALPTGPSNNGAASGDLASAHPIDAALRRITDEHQALRVDLPA
jgi:hypothetical protein